MQMRRISLEEKIILFKSLAMSKIAYLYFLTSAPNNTIEELIKIQKNLTAPKIKHSINGMDYQNGEIKNVDVFFKIINLPYSWLRRIFDSSLYQSKIIQLFFIYTTFGDRFKFHPNLDFSDDIAIFFHSFYKSMFLNWKHFFNVNPSISTCILNQVLWFNWFIQISNKPVFYKKFQLKFKNFLMQLVDRNGVFKDWNTLKHDYDLQNSLYSHWMQFISAIEKPH